MHLTLFSLVFSARLFRPLLSGRFWSPSGGLSPSLPACLSWDEKGYPCPTRRLPVALRCCVCRLQIPWPHLTQVLTAGPRRVWPPLLAGLPHPSNPPSPVPFALQAELSRVLGLLSAESLLSAHRPHLRGACASCSQGQADCPVQFLSLKYYGKYY